MTKRDEVIEAMARAAIATRFGSEGLLMFEPIPDEFDPTGEKQKTIKRRCDEARNEADAALTALEGMGLAVVPVEPSEGMKDAAAADYYQCSREYMREIAKEDKFDCVADDAGGTYTAMLTQARKEMNDD